jgi:hypothetical protein
MLGPTWEEGCKRRTPPLANAHDQPSGTQLRRGYGISLSGRRLAARGLGISPRCTPDPARCRRKLRTGRTTSARSGI